MCFFNDSTDSIKASRYHHFCSVDRIRLKQEIKKNAFHIEKRA